MIFIKQRLLSSGLLLFFILASAGYVFSRDIRHNNSFMLLQPTGQSYHGVPLLEEVSESDPRMQTMNLLLAQTFIKEMLRLNGYVQDYPFSKGAITQKERLYLLASGR